MLRPPSFLALALSLPLACGEGGGGAETPVDPRPDLQIVRVHMDLMAAPAARLVAEIRNAGASAAAGFDCRCIWVCSSRSLYNSEMRVVKGGAIAAGEVASFSVDAPPHRFGCPDSAAVIELTCNVDEAGVVDEVDEHNNEWKGPVRLHF